MKNSLDNRHGKRGISLIAVLMFMLAATTASIVVFRWIGSENVSSGARLKGSEAWQASESGIDAVQSWLTNKAPDVGALVRAYFNQPVNNRSINITNVLSPGQQNGQISGQQNFSVFLTGVDTSTVANRPMKLTFLSVGEARDNSLVHQTAIFSIDGLYKVSVPASPTPTPPRDAPPPPAYFGPSIDFGGNNLISSAFINGNWSGNPPRATGDWVITGDATLSGNDFQVQGTTCVGGNLALNNNNFLRSGDAYVGRGFTNACGIFNNVYVENGINQPSSCNFEVEGNLTMDRGTFQSTDARPAFVLGNLVFGPTGVLSFRNQNAPANSVGGHVCIPNATGFTNLREGNNSPILGNTTNSMLAININHTRVAGNPYSTYTVGTQSFRSMANAATTIPDGGCSAIDNMVGADVAKNYCDDIWVRETGCGGEGFVVDDILKTEIDEFAGKAANQECGFANPYIPPNGNIDAAITAINECYRTSPASRLYNGFLVLNIQLNQNSDAQTERLGFNIPAGSQNNGAGNFIFIVNNNPGNARLPAMTENSVALMYLRNGASGMIQPIRCANDVYYNYLIYSLRQINEINHFSSVCPLRGTVYTPIRNDDGTLNCIGGTKIQGTTQMLYSEKVYEALRDAGVISGVGEESGGGGSSGSGGSSSSAVNPPGGDQVSDSLWIPVSSRLSVKLNSKKISRERVAGNRPNIQPSILVMPRVVFLDTNTFTVAPAGSPGSNLRGYYTYMHLNGATLADGSTNQAVCDNGFNPTGANQPGTYRCIINGGAVPHSPFWVRVVAGDAANVLPRVWIQADKSTVNRDDIANNSHCATFRVHIEDNDGTDRQVSVNFEGTSFTGWTRNPNSNSRNVNIPGDANSAEAFTVCFSGGSGAIGSITANATCDQGGCRVDPDRRTATVEADNKREVTRQRITETDANRRLDCVPDGDGESAWRIDCNGRLALSGDASYPNRAMCDANATATLVPPNNVACEVVCTVPSNATPGCLSQIVSDGNVATRFTASSKQRLYNLTVNTPGAGYTVTLTAVVAGQNPQNPALVQNCQGSSCTGTTVRLYHGLTYAITVTGGNFAGITLNGNSLGNNHSISITANGTLVITPPPPPTTIACVLPANLTAGATASYDNQRGYLTCSNGEAITGNPSWAGTPNGPFSGTTVRAVAGNYTNITVTATCGTEPVSAQPCNNVTISTAPTAACILPNPLVTGVVHNDNARRGYVTCSNTGQPPTTGTPAFTGTRGATANQAVFVAATGAAGTAGNYTNITVTGVNCGTGATNLSANCNNITIDPVRVTCQLPNNLVTGTTINAATRRGYLVCNNTGVAPTAGTPAFTGTRGTQTNQTVINGTNGNVGTAGNYTNVTVTGATCGTSTNVGGACNDVTVGTAPSSSSATPSSSSAAGGGTCPQYPPGVPANPQTACFTIDGECYGCNPARGNDCGFDWLWTGAFNPNDIGYWYVVVPCSGGGTPSSSSAATTPSSSSASGGGGTTISIATGGWNGGYFNTSDGSSVPAGVYTTIDCNNEHAPVRCWRPDASSLRINGQEVSTSACPNLAGHQCFGDGINCGEIFSITVTGSGVRCMNNW